MNNFLRLLVINIIVIVVLIGGGATGYYFYDQATNYVKTSNATVNGQAVSVVAPVSGKLMTWNATQGTRYEQNDTLGQIAGAGTDGKPSLTNVQIPQDATVAQNNGTANSFVAAGTQLAVAYNLDKLYVTANIDETSIDKVKDGQKVDVWIDAFPGTLFSGKVSNIGSATSSTFSLLSTTNTNGNYTKVTQVIPVKIKLDDFKGDKLLPGMNVTVRIHI
ncbi:MAG: HlyD family efflux transporter periplasmic adaptor subunit [Sporolactobacillus sp.]